VFSFLFFISPFETRFVKRTHTRIMILVYLAYYMTVAYNSTKPVSERLILQAIDPLNMHNKCNLSIIYCLYSLVACRLLLVLRCLTSNRTIDISKKKFAFRIWKTDMFMKTLVFITFKFYLFESLRCSSKKSDPISVSVLGYVTDQGSSCLH